MALTTFFGEDLNSSGSTRLTSTPNADGAQAAFLGGLAAGVAVESFETFSSGSVSSLNLTFPGSTGGITATLSASFPIDIESQPTGTNGVGRYPTDGNQYLEVDGDDFILEFSEPVAAFGFSGVDIGDFGGSLILTLSNGTTEVVDIGNTVGSSGSTDGSVLFFGFIDDTNTYSSITFANTAGGTDIFAFDEMTIGDLGQVELPDIVGTDDPDKIIGQKTDDFIAGRGGNDTLNGGDGNDRLDGNEGDDILYGKAGNDILNGNAGNDILRDDLEFVLLDGGDGDADRFRFWKVSNQTLDLTDVAGSTLRGIEQINLDKNGNGMILDSEAVKAASDTDMLRIMGDDTNTVDISADFVLIGTIKFGQLFDVYGANGATVYIDQDIVVA